MPADVGAVSDALLETVVWLEGRGWLLTTESRSCSALPESTLADSS